MNLSVFLSDSDHFCHIPPQEVKKRATQVDINTVKNCDFAFVSEVPKVLGWERNERQKLGARMVDLSSSMDPTRLVMHHATL